MITINMMIGGVLFLAMLLSGFILAALNLAIITIVLHHVFKGGLAVTTYIKKKILDKV